MGRPCFTFYLRPQIIQAVEDDPSDRDQFVNAAAVLALRPDTCFSPSRIPKGRERRKIVSPKHTAKARGLDQTEEPTSILRADVVLWWNHDTGRLAVQEMPHSGKP